MAYTSIYCGFGFGRSLPFHIMRLRTRFTLANFVLVLAVLSATGGLQYVAERRQLTSEQESNQETALRALGKSCEEAMIDKNDLAILNYIKAFISTPGLCRRTSFLMAVRGSMGPTR